MSAGPQPLLPLGPRSPALQLTPSPSLPWPQMTSSLTRIKAVGESVGSLSCGPSPRSSPDSSVFPRDSSSSSMVTWRLRESLECRQAGPGGGTWKMEVRRAWTQNLKGLQCFLNQHLLLNTSSLSHLMPVLGSAPGPVQTPEGFRAIPYPVWISAASSIEGRPSQPPFSTPHSSVPTASPTTKLKIS